MGTTRGHVANLILKIAQNETVPKKDNILYVYNSNLVIDSQHKFRFTLAALLSLPCKQTIGKLAVQHTL